MARLHGVYVFCAIYMLYKSKDRHETDSVIVLRYEVMTWQRH